MADNQSGAVPRYEPGAVARMLVATGEKLVGLMAAETELLRQSKTVEIAALSAEKSRLGEIFATGWRQFQASPGALAGLTPDLQAELRRVGTRLDQVASENEEMLKAGKRAAELVLAAVARAVDAQTPRPTYTAYNAAPQGRPAPRGRTGLGLNHSA